MVFGKSLWRREEAERSLRDSSIEALQEDAGPVLTHNRGQKIEIADDLSKVSFGERIRLTGRRQTLKFLVNSSFSHCSAADRMKFPRHPTRCQGTHSHSMFSIYLWRDAWPLAFLQSRAERRRIDGRGDWPVRR